VKFNDPTGKFAQILFGAAIGGVLGAAIEFGVQVTGFLADGQSLSEAVSKVDVNKVIGQGVSGAVAGGFVAACPVCVVAAPASLVAVGVVGDQLGYLTTGLLNEKDAAAKEKRDFSIANGFDQANKSGFGDLYTIGKDVLLNTAGLVLGKKVADPLVAKLGQKAGQVLAQEAGGVIGNVRFKGMIDPVNRTIKRQLSPLAQKAYAFTTAATQKIAEGFVNGLIDASDNAACNKGKRC
jgi:hypothetical protein